MKFEILHISCETLRIEKSTKDRIENYSEFHLK
jgi:hypothetical protein